MRKRTISLIVVNFLLAYIILFGSTIPSMRAFESEYTFGAHRGASLNYTENTLDAFKAAIEDPKYEFIEFDIQYTKDRKIAVLHVNNKFKVPKNFIDVEEMTHAEIEEELGHKIPLLEEVLETINYQKPIEVEIKSHGVIEDDEQLVEIVVGYCKFKNKCNMTLISSPSEHIVEYVEDKYPEIRSGRVYWLVPKVLVDSETFIADFYNDTRADILFLHALNLKNYDMLKLYKPENKTLAFWYFTDEIYILDDDIFNLRNKTVK